MSARACAIVLLILAGSARGQQPIEAGNPGEQVMTRGPVHEAFAGPVIYDPKPGLVVAKYPPDPIPEMPPDQKPEGANVQWISGYWAWDDSRNDYLWVSGVWRNIPPGRQWVPGYWHEASAGVQWVPGVWMAERAETRQYLAPPPMSLESGPNSPPPTPDSIWAPGSWVWQEAGYYWRPGFWVAPQPNWVWIPAQYVWTPGGYLFTEGYWDRPIATRGLMFAPVYYSEPVYLQPNYIYQPTIGIVASGLMVSLFVRPSCNAYYFGDYYGSNYVGFGIYPWYSFHQSRYGYDPLYSYYSSGRPGWGVSIREEYVYRRDHIEARPAHSYAEMSRTSRTDASFARPIERIAASPGAGMRFHRIEPSEQRQQVRQAERLQEFRQERSHGEALAIRDRRPGETIRPRAVEMQRSPIAHAPAHPEARQTDRAEAVAPHHTPPAHPEHPALDRAAQPMAAGHPSPRPEPRFEAHQAAHAAQPQSPRHEQPRQASARHESGKESHKK